MDTLRLMMLKPGFITDYLKERGYSLIDTLFAGSLLP